MRTCPFCQWNNASAESTVRRVVHRDQPAGAVEVTAWVECPGCHARGPAHTATTPLHHGPVGDLARWIVAAETQAERLWDRARPAASDLDAMIRAAKIVHGSAQGLQQQLEALDPDRRR